MPAPRWLDDREERAWRAYVRMRIRLGARLDRHLQRTAGLSDADYGVLVNLSEAPDGRMRAFELGRATQWEKSRLSHHVKRMAARGLVVRQSCEIDRRGTEIVLTPAGRAAIEAAAPAHVAQVRRYFIEALTAEQLDALAAISDAVVAALDASEPCDSDDGC